MTYWEFLARQQADPALATIPIVVLSAAPLGDAAAARTRFVDAREWRAG
jgi:hypothetical protein